MKTRNARLAKKRRVAGTKIIPSTGQSTVTVNGKRLKFGQVSTGTGLTRGGKRMPGPKAKKKVAKKKVKTKRKKMAPLIGVAPGQKGRFRIGSSDLEITRSADTVTLGRMPKVQRFRKKK